MIAGVYPELLSQCLPLTVAKAVGSRAHSVLPMYTSDVYDTYTGTLYHCTSVPLYHRTGCTGHTHAYRSPWAVFSTLFATPLRVAIVSFNSIGSSRRGSSDV